MGDLNTDTDDNDKNDNDKTKAQKGTSIDVLLTNRPKSFHKMGIFETGNQRSSQTDTLCISFLFYTYST